MKTAVFREQSRASSGRENTVAVVEWGKRAQGKRGEEGFRKERKGG